MTTQPPSQIDVHAAPAAPAPRLDDLEQWLPLVWWCVRRYSPLVPPACREACTDDDLAGAALDGLLAACRRFDPTRGANFLHYARLTMRWYILGAAGLRSEGWRTPPRSLDAPLTVEDDAPHQPGAPRWADRTADPAGDDPAAAACVTELFAALTPRQATVLWLRVLEDQSFDQIAAQLGVTRGCVRLHYEAACKRARKHWSAA